MKKTLFLSLFVAVIAAGLSSCTVRQTEVVDCPCHIYNPEFTIRNNEWKEGNGSLGISYLYYTVSVPQLTREAYLNGSVTCYLEYDSGTPNAVQRAMPFCQHGSYEQDGLIYLYTTTLDYEYSIGQITIYYTLNEATNLSMYLPDEPGDLHFHVNIQY